MTCLKEKRNRFYSEIPNFFANVNDMEYSLYDVMKVEKDYMKKAKDFANKMGKIFFKTYQLLSSELITEKMLLDMGYPLKSIPYIRNLNQNIACPTIIGRFDSVLVDGVHKLLEFNADTPTFLYELFVVNNLVSKEFGLTGVNPKREEQVLSDSVNFAIDNEYRKLKKESYPNVIFTSHEDNQEDKETVLYLMSLCKFKARYVPLEKLQIIKDEALLDENGEIIDVLYRQTYPLESLIEDKGIEDGAEIGLMLLDLNKSNKIALINPPSAFLLQNKAVMAIIWGLHKENSPFFTEMEHKWIETHFLPTYFDNEWFLSNGKMFVKKPTFGREGDTVQIYNGRGSLIDEDSYKTYTEYQSVYQEYVSLPITSFSTENGLKEGHYMIGTFLINGKGSASGVRVGNKITDNLSYFLPIGF